MAIRLLELRQIILIVLRARQFWPQDSVAPTPYAIKDHRRNPDDEKASRWGEDSEQHSDNPQHPLWFHALDSHYYPHI